MQNSKLKRELLEMWHSWKAVVGWGGVILIVALFLRTYNLFSIPVFADEAIYVRWAQVMRAEPTLRFLPLSDGKQPLFMWSIIPFFKVFSDPLVAGRAVSVLSGIGSLVGIFLLTYVLFSSKKTALLASLFYAVSPFSVFFDRMALVDSMLTMFGIWSLFFGVLTARTLRLDASMLTGFALGGAWLTKSPAVFFLLLLPTTLLVSLWPKRERIWHGIKLLGLWIVSWAIAFAMYNILRLGPNFHLISSRNKDYVFTFREVLTHPFDPLQFHLREIVEWFWVLLPGSILILALLGLVLGWKRYKKELVLLSLWALFPLLVQAEFAKVFTARYILFTIPPVIVLAAAPAALGLEKLARRLKINHFLLFGLAVLPSLWINYLLLTSPQNAPLPRVERSGYLEEWTAGQGIRQVAEYVKGEHRKDREQGIVVGTEGYFGTLPDGLQIYLNKLENVTVIGIGLSIKEVPEPLVEAKKAGNKVYLVINSTRFKGDADELGLRLLESYPKALRPDGTRESLLFFEVTNEAITPKVKEGS